MAVERYDVVVVGAGPAGSAAARRAALGGARTLLLEARRLPRPKTCAGGISPRARTELERVGLWDRIAPEAYPIRGIRLAAPSGRETELVGAGSAHVLERSRLDHLLAAAAVDAGAELREGVRVTGLVESFGRIGGVRTASGEIEAPWVVAAAGAHARCGHDPRPRRLLHSCMARFDRIPFAPGVLEMYFDPEIAPHYGWLFPESDSRANIGLCIEAHRLGGRSVRDLFARFLARRFGPRLADAVPLGPWQGHPLVVTREIEHHAPPGLFLAGEACRLVNPATGEGISYALESGRMAADGLLAGEAPEEAGRRYARRIRRAFAPAFAASDLFRAVGIATLDPIVRLGNHRWFRRLAGQSAAAAV